MTRLVQLIAFSLVGLQSLVSAGPIPPKSPLPPPGFPFPIDLDRFPPFTRCNLTSRQVQRELGPLLSKESSIFGPADSRWENATERYQTFAVPDVKVVVRPGTEEDVSKIVKYANWNSVAFMAKNRGHALTATVGNFTGIQIDMTSLTDIKFQPDMRSAWFQGGTYDDQVMRVLWDKGYVATTGSCSCVGMMGPGLGGGHGRYQGLYGLISDNLLNINLVLADGRKVQVNEREHSDLWWAMQGAGHNFGIVTSFELKIYPKEVDSWYYRNYIFKGDKLESFIEEINKFQNNGSQPGVMAGDLGIYAMNRTIDDNPILFWSFIYAGPQKDADKALERFEHFDHAYREDGNLPFPQIPNAQGSGLGDPLCEGGKTHITTTAGLQVYNITAQRQIYDLYQRKVAEKPELSAARVVMEGYSPEGVRRGDPAKSAFPHRDDYLLTYFDVEDPQKYGLTDYALEWARETRDLWNNGQSEWRRSRPSTYVNYALGDETLEAMYGYEPWRLDRLKELKAKYDPHQKFSYYNPIPPAKKPGKPGKDDGAGRY